MSKRLFFWILFLPLQVAIILLFLLCDLLRLLLPGAPAPARGQGSAERRTDVCSIVILNWNGRELLQQSLPALFKAIRFAAKDHEVIVVDNGSSDGSVEWIRVHYPEVRLVALTENLGFGEGNNRGVEAASRDIVVLLNNDMIVAEDFLLPLLEGFADSRVFAVSSQIFFAEGKRREETGNTQARLERGYLHLAHEPLQPCHYSRRYLPVLWAGGGSSAFDRRLYLEWGGFAELFSPCYLEDTDLSYGAWRRGWKVVLAAHSRVLHKHRSSSAARFKEGDLKQLVEERKLWYLWKNYQTRTLLGHFLCFPVNLSKYLSAVCYLKALRRLPRVLRLRARQGPRACSDRSLFEWIRRPLTFLKDSQDEPQRGSTLPAVRPLRILIASAYLPHLGRHGGAGRVFQLLRRAARKHLVSLVAFVETQEEASELEQVAPYCARIETVLRRHFRPVSNFPYEPFEEFNCPALRNRLEQILAEEDFDLVHFEWTQMAQYADLVPPRCPTLLTEIEVNYAAHSTLVPFEHRPLRKLKRYYDSLQTLYREIELCRRVDAVICVTESDRRYLEGYLPARKLFVVNTGVDTRFFSPDGEEQVDPNAIIFVGAFRHGPNVDAMLHFCSEVFPLILREQPEARLYIVGAGPPPSILQLGAHPNIRVTGFVEDIRNYYRKARVVIVPLRTGVGIRGKILEGWAAGKAMVATSLACLGIAAVHGENIVIADRPQEFALWTLALLNNPDYCRRLGQAGRETVLRYYDWDRLGEQMIAIYERLTERRAAQASGPESP